MTERKARLFQMGVLSGALEAADKSFDFGPHHQAIFAEDLAVVELEMIQIFGYVPGLPWLDGFVEV